MVIVDGHGHIALVNAQAERLFGYRRQEIVGQGISELIPKRLRAAAPPAREGLPARRRRAPDGQRPRALRAAQGRQRVPGRDQPQPARDRRGPARLQRDPRRQRAQARASPSCAAAEELFRGAFDGSPIGMALTDDDGRVVRVNDALCDLTGRTARAAHRLALRRAHAPRRGRLRPQGDQRAAVAASATSTRSRRASCTPAGAPIWVGAAGDDDHATRRATPRRFLVQVQDVTHRRRYEENLHYLATHDPLTGLHNRSSFADQLDTHADLVRRYGTDGALLLLDLDHFKYVNDTLGHAGRRPAHRARREGARARGCATPTCSRGSAATSSPRCCRGPTRADAPSASPRTCSTALRAERIAVPGTGRAHDHREHRRRDVRARATALQRRGRARQRRPRDVRRQGGRAQPGRAARRAASTRRRACSGRITWAERIRVAIDEDRFTLVAQPIFDLETGVVTQFEVLLRMLDDHGDLIPPSAFLSTAERLGMIQQIDAIDRRARRSARSPPPATGDRRAARGDQPLGRVDGRSGDAARHRARAARDRASIPAA